MGLRKFGTGEVLPEPGDEQKTAGRSDWSDADDKALAEECTSDEGVSRTEPPQE